MTSGKIIFGFSLILATVASGIHLTEGVQRGQTVILLGNTLKPQNQNETLGNETVAVFTLQSIPKQEILMEQFEKTEDSVNNNLTANEDYDVPETQPAAAINVNDSAGFNNPTLDILYPRRVRRWGGCGYKGLTCKSKSKSKNKDEKTG